MEYITYYSYDGSYYGLLTALQRRFQSSKRNILIIPEYQQNSTGELFAEYHKITTNNQLARSLSRKIKKQISEQAEKKLYYAFLSRQSEIENHIFNYLYWGFQIGKQIDERLRQQSVRKINDIERKVAKERHKMLGFLRFEKLSSGIYYAAMEPDFDIITLIASHFRKRLRDQSWIIHDKLREKYALYNQTQLIYTNESITEDKLSLHSEEKHFQSMWKKYFHNISIPERQNLKLQQQFLPKKYRKYLTEKK